ncbi:MAG: NAD(P)-dependent oxidoreductase [Devosia sp.]|uniref:NAD(P)-dependent oxidoreductase n=1 Tax=Devosia sp. TaxID=1871048 RepID=UPI001AC8F31D|nr:NAD(P)-dependent oxidoreductase [Devosia sp.]MBN9315661.1 NAD(P)-dependent oxidoreductase [Devosia sp.]
MPDQIGFIGLGTMGRGMAANLLKAGFSLHVWNRSAPPAEMLRSAGAIVASSPAELARQCDVVIVCVSDTADVEAVILGEHGVLAGARPGSLVIDCSSISPKVTREIAARLAVGGVAMLDAPVSGGSEGAKNGTLSIMVGGLAEQVERARPVFAAMGKATTHVGPIGAGQTVKLVNQVLVVGNALAMSEALLLAQASGVDLQKAFDAVSQGAGGSWMFTNRGPQILARDWRPGFSIALQQKDLRLILEAGRELNIPLIASSLIANLYATLEARGLGGDGNHALIKAIENLANIEVGGAATTSAAGAK